MDGITIQSRRGSSTPEIQILIGVAVVIAACTVLLASVGVNAAGPEAYISNASLYVAIWGIVECGAYLQALYTKRPQSPLRFLPAHLRDRLPILLRGLPLVAAVIVFMPTFSAMKASVPLFADYTWDAALIAADRAIFGTDPWRLLQPLVGYPLISSALSVAYHLWILLIYAGSVWFAVYCRDDAMRLRYFASYFTLWTVCGIAMAIGFASVGPCFVSPILGLDAFDAQMEYLSAANQRYPVMVLEVQEILLEWHRSGQHGLGRGITAMPSMHVALATLFWLAIRRGSRLLDLLFGLFSVVIFIGSIHLAYHYAVDGLVGAAMALGIWRTSGKLFNKLPDRAAALPLATQVPR
jgi:hypothetical protein